MDLLYIHQEEEFLVILFRVKLDVLVKVKLRLLVRIKLGLEYLESNED